MRTSLLSRSVIAVASLAIGSVALAATPATATPAEVVTRDLVLAVAQQEPSSTSNPSDELARLVSLTCGFQNGSGDDHFHTVNAKPFVTDNVDGVLVSADLHEPSAADDTTDRQCNFAAVITTDASFTLSGNAVITVTGGEPLGRMAEPLTETGTTPLSGNLVVTAPINVDNYFNISTASLAATGNAIGSTNVTTTENVKVLKPRTKAGEKAAKAKYAKRLADAKKWYAKALDKAGNSKRKQAAVKKSYAAKKAAYKAAYEKRYSMIQTVTKTTAQTVTRPFDVSVSVAAGSNN